MNKLMTFWIINGLAMLVSATAVYGAPPELGLSLSSEFQFAGYTEQRTSGDAAGYAGMNSICQQEFGESARMCTTKEWFNTHGTRQPQLPPDRAAWVQPDFVAAVYNSLTQKVLFTDWTGTTYGTIASTPHASATCNQWTSNNNINSGTMVSNEPVTNHDIVRTQLCTVELMVTCCTPAQVTADH